MADPTKYKSLSVTIIDWQDLGTIASKTNRTRSKMIARLIRFYKENRGEKKNAKIGVRHYYLPNLVMMKLTKVLQENHIKIL